MQPAEIGAGKDEGGGPPPSLDAQICRFLREMKAETNVAPVLEAGVATRTQDKWEMRWGTTESEPLAHFFDLASITKAHFAVCVSLLVAQGVLDFTTTLQEILPEVRGTYAGAQTVEALLSHRAGLCAHLELFRPAFCGAPVRIDELMLQVAQARSQHSAVPPSPLYSDLGYILMGFALERLQNQDLDATVQETLLGPWKLGSGSVRQLRRLHPSFSELVLPTEVQPPRGGLLCGQVHDDNAWALRGTALCGHAGLFGRVQDVVHFGTRLMDGVLGRSGREGVALLAPLLKRRPGGSLRMGFDGVGGPGTMAGNQAGSETFGHLGFTGTSLWCDPERDRVTVLLSHRVYPTRHNPKIRLVRPKIHDFLWAC